MKFFVDGPSGRLEALFEEPPEDVPTSAAAVVCHPHPLHGGTLHNTVVHRTARGLRSVGVATLRFNFRGVEESEGVHDGVGGEVSDAAAALDWLERERPHLPLWAAGFSFGSRTVVALTLRDRRVEHLVAICLPTRVYEVPGVATLRLPSFFLFAARDEFGNLADFERAVGALPPNFECREIPATDHFFRGATPALEEAVREHAQRALRGER